jgi:hypothetical protein
MSILHLLMAQKASESNKFSCYLNKRTLTRGEQSTERDKEIPRISFVFMV